MSIINVNTSKNYKIYIEQNFANLSSCLKEKLTGEKVLIITDKNVFPLYYNQVVSAIENKKFFSYVLPSGEKQKNTKNYLKIINFLAENLFTRKDTIIALGGGVVGDITGFVCATYMRGVNFIQIPTSLLAMVDSSVGGKTAVNIKKGKNLLGAFYQPSFVYISLSALNTLPEKEITNGMGEVIKYAFLSKTVTKEMVKELNYLQIVENCLKIKVDIVEKDEFENGNRALLNLGHTIGHAIENLSKYKISHGLCVAKGINKAIDIAKKYYNLSGEQVLEMKNLLNAYPFNLTINYQANKIAEKILIDKKAESSFIKFVLPKEIGCVIIEKIETSKLGELLND
ncbi:MAG: 3-dehydroquinate synthase [Clostridia bacterium]|nr:3-dehydroquinate synthase [Clostridia bacterium]